MATIDRTLFVTYGYLAMYIFLSSGVIMYNKWVLSANCFGFPFPLALTMMHMGFSAAVTFILVRLFKVVKPTKMTFKIYMTGVVPISAFFAASLWFGNTAYLYLSVAFIQMLKALVPVATLLVAMIWGTEKPRWDFFFNMLLISIGVAISSYGEVHFSLIGTLYQVSGMFAEALRLVLAQVLLQKRGLTFNPVTTLYYVAPCSFLFLSIPWYLLELSAMKVEEWTFDSFVFFTNALCALALNFSVFLAIGRTGAVTVRVAAVVKDWILIILSAYIFTDSKVTAMNIEGYAVALGGVVLYNYLKMRDASTDLLPLAARSDMLKDKKQEDKSMERDDRKCAGLSALPPSVEDQEAPTLITSLSRLLSLVGHSLRNFAYKKVDEA